VTKYRYGERDWGQGHYGGYGDHRVDYPVAAFVEVYDSTGALVQVYQAGSSDLLQLTFRLDEAGCSEFSLSFSHYVKVEKKYTVRIKLFGSDDYFYHGVVRYIPIDGSTKSEFVYGGFGLVDYLSRIITGEESYAGDTLEEIVVDLLDRIITVKTPIRKNLAKIAFDSVITVTGVNFHYISVMEALKQVQDIASSDGSEYVYGVDADGDFFFRPRSSDVAATLVVGKRGTFGIDAYEPSDSYEAKSKLVVLRDDGTYFGEYASTEDVDVFEEKLTGPDVDDDELDLWAQGQLLVKEQETRQATVNWQIERVDPVRLTADGWLRVISSRPPSRFSVGTYLFGTRTFGAGLFGGDQSDLLLVDDTLKIREVTYTISGSMASREIQLGSIPVRLDREMVEIHKDVQSLRVSLGR